MGPVLGFTLEFTSLRFLIAEAVRLTNRKTDLKQHNPINFNPLENKAKMEQILPITSR